MHCEYNAGEFQILGKTEGLEGVDDKLLITYMSSHIPLLLTPHLLQYFWEMEEKKDRKFPNVSQTVWMIKPLITACLGTRLSFFFLFYTPISRQFNTIDKHRLKIVRNRAFDCHLLPDCRQMTIKNSVSSVCFICICWLLRKCFIAAYRVCFMTWLTVLYIHNKSSNEPWHMISNNAVFLQV